MSCFSCVFFFFFQAEDGIRDLYVTGVQTCALPISTGDRKQRTEFADRLRDLVARGRAAGIIVLAATQRPSSDVVPTSLRDLFGDRKSTRLNSSHVEISYAVFCLKKKT